MLRALPRGAVVSGAVEVDSADEQLDLGVNMTWLFRGGNSAAPSTNLVDAVRGLALPSPPGVAYLAGEARTLQLIRRHLVDERGWSRPDIVTKPFWTPGQRGLE